MKYTQKGEFIFTISDRLSKVCNAPSGKYGGVYIIYAISPANVDLVYIGISGRLDKLTGGLIARKDGIAGRIVKGKRDGEPRKDFWVREMIRNDIQGLKICWYVVNDESLFTDCPESIERKLITKYQPEWNRRREK